MRSDHEVVGVFRALRNRRCGADATSGLGFLFVKRVKSLVSDKYMNHPINVNHQSTLQDFGMLNSLGGVLLPH